TTPPPAATSCRVQYGADSWNNGLVATITVTNTSPSPVNGWTVQWTWPNSQQVTSAWNATVTQSGNQVTARNAAYNGTIAANQSVSFGLQASHTGTNTPPNRFTLNGAACS
ncbi:cellulose binding domain-containing protein, partial [Micromonospora endophytica]